MVQEKAAAGKEKAAEETETKQVCRQFCPHQWA
jgi:hypothetical protein